ncbi:hypothetical protein ABN763_17730 [Spongiivirga sp. MCCC 1A20706]|uniref:hypothetical protein n=1 Tax=Spongiivirga sp. MCCC 1A20706 TaxID=3160963 RepID=UPI0039776C58
MNKSIFNLIEIFRKGNKKIINTISPKSHCELKSHHDFYCEAEKPFITKENIV